MKTVLFLRNIRPVARLKEWITRTFRLQKKGRKLLEAGVALFGVTAGVSLLQMTALFTCGLGPQMWGRIMLPWLPVFGWALWRFFLRYLDSEAFVCDRCERLKCQKHQSEKFFGKAKICRECERRGREVSERIDKIQKELDAICQGINLVGKYPTKP